MNDMQALPLREKLSLLELINLVPTKEVHTLAQGLFSSSLLWAMSQRRPQSDWLSNILNKPAEAIDAEQEAIVRQSLSWYQNVVARAILTSQIQSNFKDARPRLDKKGELALKAFLAPDRTIAAKGHWNITSSSHFQRQNSALYDLAYLKLQPRLRAYIADADGAWAARLVDLLQGEEFMERITDQVMGQMATGNAGASVNLEALAQYTSLLQILDRSGNSGAQFGRTVINAAYTKLVIKSSKEVDLADEQYVRMLLPAILGTILTQAANGMMPASWEVSPEQAKSAYAVFLENGPKGVELVNQAFLAWRRLDRDMQNAVPDYLFRDFDLDRPNMSILGNLFVLAGVVFNVVVTLMAWSHTDFSKLTPKQQFDIIVQTTQTIVAVPLGFGSANMIFKQLMRKWNPLTSSLARAARSKAQARIEFEESFYEVELPDYGTFGAPAGAFQKPVPERISLLGKLEKGFGSGVAILTFIASVWDTKEQFDNHESSTRKGLSAGVAAANGFAAVALTVDFGLAFASEGLLALSAAMPYLAIFFTGAAIILQIALFFQPIKTPADVFMEKFGKPFVDGLSEQGETLPIFDDTPHWTAHTNLKGKIIHSVEVVHHSDYGIVNMRFMAWDGNNGSTVKAVPSSKRHDGWMTDNETSPFHSAPAKGHHVDGLWFAKHENHGIVNLNVHTAGKPTWDGWMLQTEEDSTAERVSAPRIVDEIGSVRVRNEPGYGIVDAVFTYATRLE